MKRGNHSTLIAFQRLYNDLQLACDSPVARYLCNWTSPQDKIVGLSRARKRQEAFELKMVLPTTMGRLAAHESAILLRKNKRASTQHGMD